MLGSQAARLNGDRSFIARSNKVVACVYLMVAQEDLNIHRYLLVDKEQELVLNYLLVAIRKHIMHCEI